MNTIHSMVFGIMVLITLVLAGCSSRSRISAFIFDGIPYPPEEICKDYCSDALAAQKEIRADKKEQAPDAAAKVVSSHRPYKEKRCDACHDQGKENGLIVQKEELCFQCHPQFSGSYVHGPVAVGGCLVCHLPHSSFFPSLLAKSGNEMCAVCHQEQRLSPGLHDKASQHMVCSDCHDPHAGKAKFLLK